MRNLLLEEGGLLQVESASLPVASYAKFQPQSVDFLDITNPKAVYPLMIMKPVVHFADLLTTMLFFLGENLLSKTKQTKTQKKDLVFPLTYLLIG